MSNTFWIKNLRYDIDCIFKYVYTFKQYIKALRKKTNVYTIACSSIYSQFIDSLESVGILLLSNYKDDFTLYGVNINNLDGMFILLRKIIESNAMMNIIINNDRQLCCSYLEQYNNDETNIGNAFKNSTNWFNSGKIKKYNKYEWLSNFFKKRVISINDLIDLCKLTPDAKIQLKSWSKECNYMSHSCLYSDAKTIGLINGSWIDDLRYVFSVLGEIMHVFSHIVERHEIFLQYSVDFEISEIVNIRPNFTIFDVDFLKEDRTCEAINFSTLLKQRQDVYNIRAEGIMIGMIACLPLLSNGLTKEKKYSLQKLMDTLSQDVYDMLTGFYENKINIFYPKIRQILEGVSYIEKLLLASEEQVILYQTYTDIQRYNNVNYINNVHKNGGAIGIEFKNIQTNAENGETVQQLYESNLKIYKDYYLKKYNYQISINDINKPNSWLCDGNKIPSNWSVIQSVISSFKEELNQNMQFFKGLYNLSSSICHVSSFGNGNCNIYNKNTQIVVLKAILVLVSCLYKKLLTYTKFNFEELYYEKMNELEKLINSSLK